MKKLSIRETRQVLGRIDVVLRDEGDLVITRRGRPVARVVPASTQPRPMPSHQALRASTRRLTRPSEVVLREERDAR